MQGKGVINVERGKLESTLGSKSGTGDQSELVVCNMCRWMDEETKHTCIYFQVCPLRAPSRNDSTVIRTIAWHPDLDSKCHSPLK